jgi:Mg-chelatase subunit ChlD
VLGGASLQVTTSPAGLGFENPAYVAASLPGVVLVALLLLRARRRRGDYIRILGGRVSRLTWLTEAGRVVGLAMLALASGTPYVSTVDYVEVSPSDLEALRSVGALHVILVDNSRSMGYRDGPRERIEVARGFIESYLSQLNSSERVEVYSFSSTARLLCSGSPLDCLAALEGLDASERYSAVGTALGVGVARVEAADEPALVVLVTDGASNYGPDPRDVARGIAASTGGSVPVAVVRVGSDPRAGALEEAAAIMGARLYEAGSSAGDVIEDLAGEVYVSVKYEALEARASTRVQVESRDYTIHWILIALGLAILLASMVVYP